MSNRKEKIKLIGQLLEDSKPTTLIIAENLTEIGKTAREYKAAFPDIFLSAEWGYFKSEISNAKREALSNLFFVLNSPLQNVFNGLTQVKN